MLYASAFLTQENTWLFEVTVKYKDGSTGLWCAWPVILRDWLSEPVRTFWGEYSTTAACTVPVSKDKTGTVYRTEWIFDRAKHDVPVESITINGNPAKGVPLILGLTGVTQW
jgi:hypothetical protein